MDANAGMDVSVRRKVIVAVAQPGLDVLQRIPQIQHDGRTAVPQIMKADLPHAILIQDLWEFVGDEIRLEQGSHGIHADKILVSGVVAVAADLLLIGLLLPEVQKILVGVGAEGEGPHTGF